MKKNRFIIINTIHHMIEFSLIYLLLRSLIHSDLYLWLTMGFIFSLSLVFMVSQFNVSQIFKGYTKKVDPSFLDDIRGMIDHVDMIEEDDFLVFNISSLPSSAMYSNGKIYINEAYGMARKNREALLAHELGHYISSMVYNNALSVMGYASFRPSFYISRLYKSLRTKLIYHHKLRPRSIIDYFFSCPIYLLFLINDFSIYLPMRKDEYIANNEAIKMGFGHELRTYYYEIDRQKKPKDLLDFEHPTARQMIEGMNGLLNMNVDLIKDVYLRHGHIVYVDSYYSDKPKRDKELAFWKVNKTDDGRTLNHIAFLYYDKGQASEDDILQAINYYKRAINQGFVGACSNLGKLYEGIKAYDMAVLAYQNGVELNDLKSVLTLARWMQRGNHIDLNLEESYKLYLKADNLGYGDAAYIKDYINQWFVAYKSRGQEDLTNLKIKFHLDGRVSVSNEMDVLTQSSMGSYRRYSNVITVFNSDMVKTYRVRLSRQELVLRSFNPSDKRVVYFKKEDDENKDAL